jgi:hypothetical protein
MPKCPLHCSRVSDVKYVTVRASSSTTKKRRLHGGFELHSAAVEESVNE